MDIFYCVYEIRGLYIIFEAMNEEKWLWLIFGCNVNQSVLIRLKLDINLWHRLLDVHIDIQINILKHVTKGQENIKKSQTREILGKFRK